MVRKRFTVQIGLDKPKISERQGMHAGNIDVVLPERREKTLCETAIIQQFESL